MIILEQKAEMQCEEPNCPARLHVDIAITIAGSFGARFPNGHGWQVMGNPAMGPGSPVLTRCPIHKTMLAARASPLSLVEPH